MRFCRAASSDIGEGCSVDAAKLALTVPEGDMFVDEARVDEVAGAGGAQQVLTAEDDKAEEEEAVEGRGERTYSTEAIGPFWKLPVVVLSLSLFFFLFELFFICFFLFFFLLLSA